MGDKDFLSGQASLWIQPDGPNTVPKYLGCHGVGDVTEPKGDLNLRYCPDPSKVNGFIVSNTFMSEAGPVTFSIETTVGEIADWLSRVHCPVPIYLHKIDCGRRDAFDAWIRSFLFEEARITSRGLSNLMARNPDGQDESTQTFEISSPDLVEVFEFNLLRQPSLETENMLDLSFCSEEQCADDCGAASNLGDDGIVGAAGGVAAANIYETTDKGVTWTVAAALPFAVAEDIRGMVCFPIDKDTTRWLVGRGTTDAANPAEIAYSDDGGATWTLVNVGSTNGQFFHGPKAIFALDSTHIWAVTDGGYIYFSDDGGLTWTAQESGTIHAGIYFGVHFNSANNGYASGAADIVAFTNDGGNTWAVTTGVTGGGGDHLTLWTHTQDTCWLGDDDGNLWYTTDGGATWTQRPFASDGVGAVNDMYWYDRFVGVIVHDSAAPVGRVLLTINGGFNWVALTTPTNAGLNAIEMVSPTLFWTVGNAQAATAVIIKGEAGLPV